LVSKRIKALVRDAQAQASAARRDRERLEHVAEQLAALGISKDAGTWEVRERLAPAGERLARVRQLTERLQEISRQIHDLADEKLAAAS
jgi:hypothetical protein